MFSFKVIFIGLTLAAASAHPYGHQHLFDAPPEYRQIEPRPVIFNKHFHFFTAPEESEIGDEIIPERFLRRNIRVVVIKAPENKRITSAITQLATSLAEEKTAIYVLNREPDVTELNSQIRRLNEEKTERPDVHFIKYKTAKEAELAAINIQSQYEYLSGPSEITTQEAAPLEHYVAPLNSELTEAKLSSSSLLYSTESLGAGPLQRLPSNGGVDDDETALDVSPSTSNDILDKSAETATTIQSGRVNVSDVVGFYLPPGTSLPVDIRTQTRVQDQ